MGLTPSFKLIAESRDISHTIAERLLSLTVTDNAGLSSDTLEIELDDENHVIELPSPGAKLEVRLGYQETSLENMGVYTVDEVELSGPPNRVVIRAKAADMNQGLKEPRTRTWQKSGKSPPRILLKEILNTIASEQGLLPRLANDFVAVDYAVVNQTEESDLNLLTRLAGQLGALVKPAGGYLLFVKKGEAKTVSGKTIPPINLRPKDISRWSVTLAEREAYQSVTTKYQDRAQSKEIEVTLGDGKPNYLVRKVYKDEGEAKRAAQAQLEAFQRGNLKINLDLPGNPTFVAEAPLNLYGFRDGVNYAWVVETATHSLNSGGYTLSLTGTVKKPAGL